MAGKSVPAEGVVEKQLAVVEALDDVGPAGVTELAAELDMAKSTVHYHLKTLVEHDFLVTLLGRGLLVSSQQ